MRWAFGICKIISGHSPRMLPKLSWRQRISYVLLQPFYPAAAFQWVLSAALTTAYMVSGVNLGIPGRAWALCWGSSVASVLGFWWWSHRFNLASRRPGLTGLALALMTLHAWASAALRWLACRGLPYVVTPKGDAASPDRLATFRPHLAWLGWAAGLLALGGAGVLHAWPLILFWASVTAVICAAPVTIHLAGRLSRRGRRGPRHPARCQGPTTAHHAQTGTDAVMSPETITVVMPALGGPDQTVILAPPADGLAWTDRDLAQLNVFLDTKPVRAIRQRVVVLIPAYNGAAGIAGTIKCLQRQTRQPDRIVIVANNCADDTAGEARRAGADVWETHGETRVKADALNHAFEHVLLHLADNALVMVIDDDTAITPGFIEEAIAQFEAHPEVGGLSAVYHGRPGKTWASWCQRNEFARWGFDCRQQRGDGELSKAICLSGACSILRVRALRDVIAARRAGRIGGGDGARPVIYREDNQTEDFELSVALMHCGWKIRNMLHAGIETAVKPTWTELHVQRLRWNGGITETLLQYGWSRYTRAMWIRWIIYAFSVMTIPLSLFLVSERLASGAGLHLNAWMFLWIGVSATLSVHKTITVCRTRGAWTAMAAFLLIAELPYDLFLHLTFARSLWLYVTRADTFWR